MSKFNIDSEFSVYQLVKRSLKDKSVLNHRRTMSIISSEIENATLVDGAETVVFSAFQRMSRFLPQEKRYRKLAKTAKHIFVFGVMDTDVPDIDNLTYVPLKPTDQLAKEWFLISFGRDYFSALATEELTHIDDPDSIRKFKGVWTFDVFMVSILHDWLCGTVGLRYEERQVESHNYLKQAQLISNTIGRMAVRVMDNKEHDRVVHSELQKIMQATLHPTLNNMQKDPMVEARKTPKRMQA